MKYTAKQIHDAAELAAFYVTPGGLWLRMMYTNDDNFCALDEDSGEEYDFYFDEMVEEEEDPVFHELVRMTIVNEPSEPSEVWSEP